MYYSALESMNQVHGVKFQMQWYLMPRGFWGIPVYLSSYIKPGRVRDGRRMGVHSHCVWELSIELSKFVFSLYKSTITTKKKKSLKYFTVTIWIVNSISESLTGYTNGQHIKNY